MYVYCVVCYSVIAAHMYTLDNDSECPMDYETSLLPKVCPCTIVYEFTCKSMYGSLLQCQGESPDQPQQLYD